MEKHQIQQTLHVLKETSPKRKFAQTIDLIINLKDLDLKKPENKVDTYSQLHFTRGKATKICALVDVELLDQARKHFDTVIAADDFGKYTDKKVIKKLASRHQFFIAQANIMPKVATIFGKALGPRGKMPNPKAGCVVPANANLEMLKEKLEKTVRIKIDNSPMFQTFVGTEESKEEEIIDNILTIHKALIASLPSDVHNIREVLLKVTMGKPIKIQDHTEQSAKAGKKGARK